MPMTLPVSFDHCVVHVSDWERSNAFYRDSVAAQLVHRPARWPGRPPVLTPPAGPRVHLAKLAARTVIYSYPRTGVPGQPLPEGWNEIPGARGCTPQSCGFRDHFSELKRLAVLRVFGLSTQDTGYQREAVDRLHLPFPVLSDERLELAHAIELPTFKVAGMTLLKRM